MKRIHHPVLAAFLSMLTAAFILPALPAQAAVTFLSTLAGPSVASMYDSGLEFDDANNRIVVADTGLDRIDFYDENGNIVAPPFGTHGTANGQFDSPRDVAIGSSSRIFVADAGNNRVQAFTSTGTWLWTDGGTGTCNTCLNTPIGVSWDAANQQLLVASTGQDRIKAFDQNGNWLWSSPVAGTGVGQININAPRDAARGPDGRLWLSDYEHHQVKAFDVSPTGVFASTTPAITLGDGLAQGHGDGQVNFPYNMDFSLDGHTVYVSDTGNNRVAMWNLTTSPPTWIGAFGGNCPETPDTCADPPADFGYIDTLRRVVIDPAGNAITADFWGNGMQTWTASGTPIKEIELVTPPAPGFAQPFGVAVAPNGSVYAVDRLNQRLERFNAAGVYQNDAGNRGTAPGRFSWPEAIAVAPDGTVWVGDTRNDRIQKWPASLSPLPPMANMFGGTGSAVGKFNYIEDLDVAPSGLVYVADTDNNRIQVFTPGPNTFTAIGALGTGPGQFTQPQGVAVSSTNIYVADTGNNRIEMLDLSGNYVAQYSTGLSGPQGVAVGADGTIWVADTNNNRLVHLSSDLQANLGDGFGGLGTGNMQFNLPHTLAAFGSKLYVADTFNNRVQIFDTGVVIPDTTRPTAAITTPSAGQSFPQGTVLFNGTASDNVGVAAVRVGIQNTANGQWWQSNGTWAATQQLQTAILTDPGQTSTGWSYSWTFPSGAGSYSLVAEAADAAGNRTSPQPARAFTVTSGVDATVPAVTVTVPTPNQSFPNAPITFAGTATDNLGVTRVDVDIKNRTTGLWLRNDGSWGAFQVQPAITGSPGATSTSWSFGWTPPAGDGAYSVFAQPQDAKGNKSNKTVQFNVTSGGGVDSTPPTVTVTVPAVNQSFPNGPISASGSATDNVGVTRVDVDIKDLNTQLWWNSNGTWGAFQTQPASIGTPGGTSTTWSYTWTPPPGSGLYSLFAQAQDAAGNKVNKTVQFSVTTGGGGGGLNATYSRQVFNAGGIPPLYPAGGATAANGDRYIADSGGSRIVKITAGGVQTTLSDASAGWNDPRDIEIDVTDPTVLWVMDTSNSRVVKLSTSGTIINTFGSASVFKTPYGLSNDATGIYVADTYNQRVMKINKTTGATIWTQTTCSGKAFLRPRDVAVGSDGNIYVADTDNNRIVRLNPTTGACQGTPPTFGTTGTGNANFKAPRSLTSDGAGGLWIADAGNNRLMHVSNTGAFIGKIGAIGNGNAQFRSAHCVFRDGALIDVCDTFNYRIEQFTVSAGVPAFSAIVGGTQPANGGFNGTFDVAYAADGSMFAIDWFNHRIEKFDAAGNFLLQFGGYGSASGSFIFPRGLVVAPNGNVVVMDSENNRIDTFTSGGVFLSSIKPTTGVSTTPFSRPYQVALDPNGTYWVADTLNNRIVNINAAGNVLASWTGGGIVNAPRGIAVDSSGNVYVSNTNNRVDKYTPAGVLIQNLASNGSGATQVKGSYGLRIVGTGANTMLLIADAGNNRVVAMTLAGVAISTFGTAGSGNGQFSSPRGMDRNPLTGEIAVADFMNNRLSIWTTS